MPIPTTPLPPAKPTTPAQVPLVAGQVYAVRPRWGDPFRYLFTLERQHEGDLWFVVGNPHGANNYRYLIGTGEAVLVHGPHAPSFADLPSEVQTFVRGRLEAHLKSHPSAHSETVVRDLCTLDDIERAVRAAIPMRAMLYVDAVDQEVRAYSTLGASDRLAIEASIAARIDGPFHVAVLPESALVARVRGQITTILAEIQTSGAYSFVVRAWTAALCGIGEPNPGMPMATPFQVELAVGLCRALTTQFDKARNGHLRPVPTVRAAVRDAVTAEHCVPPTAPWVTAMFDRFMAAYES